MNGSPTCPACGAHATLSTDPMARSVGDPWLCATCLRPAKDACHCQPTLEARAVFALERIAAELSIISGRSFER